MLKILRKIFRFKEKEKVRPRDNMYLAGGGHVRIQAGDPQHAHDFKEVPWHENSVGDDFETTPGSVIGVFRRLIGCGCGAEEVVSHGGFI